MVVAGLGRTTAQLVPLCVLAGVLLLLSAVPVRGRWLYQWFTIWVRYLVRRRRRPLPVGGDSADRAAVLLDQLSPGAVVGTVTVDGADIGLVEHQGGVTALVELGPADSGLLVDGPQPVPSPAMLLPLSEPGDPVVTIQVVVQATPAPVPGVGSSAALTSYQQLTGGLVPAHRHTWIAVQVLRTADDHADADLRAAVGSAVRRLLRRLTRDGAQVRVLDPAEALTVLGALAHVESPPSSRAHAEVSPVLREGWRAWSVPGLAQTSLRLRQWPDLGLPGGRLIDSLGAVVSTSWTVALAARRHGADIELQAVVRLAAADQTALQAATSQAREAAAASGAVLDPLHGEQVHGLAGSLPLGGFLP